MKSSQSLASTAEDFACRQGITLGWQKVSDIDIRIIKRKQKHIVWWKTHT